MNLFKEVARLCNVNFNEEFNIKGCDSNLYCFKEDGLYQLVNGQWVRNRSMLQDLLAGERVIYEKAFEPTEEQLYYYINFINYDISYAFFDGRTMDILNLYVGNCFRTYSDCEKHKDEIIQKVKEGEISGKYIQESA